MSIDNELIFDKHIDNLCKMAACQLNVIHSFRGIFDIKEK